eukprot:2806752-Pyramimonas_sp.AAC.1
MSTYSARLGRNTEASDFAGEAPRRGSLSVTDGCVSVTFALGGGGAGVAERRGRAGEGAQIRSLARRGDARAPRRRRQPPPAPSTP